MRDLIDREELLKKQTVYYDYNGEKIGVVRVSDIVEAPAVERRKTGKWLKISPAGIYECSECRQNVMTRDIAVYRFCHHCGAKMEVYHD